MISRNYLFPLLDVGSILFYYASVHNRLKLFYRKGRLVYTQEKILFPT